MEHSKTPWKIGTPPPNGEQTIGTIDGLMVAVTTTGYGLSSEANARRIVAAVNACAGLDTDQLEQFGLGTAFGTVLFDVTAERDKLRAVCAEAYQFAGAYDAPVEVLDNLSAAANGWPLPHETFLPVMDSEAVAQRDELQSQLATERASLFAENQRKQQLEQQVCALLGALELLLCDVEEAEYMTGREREAAARAVTQKVRGGE